MSAVAPAADFDAAAPLAAGEASIPAHEGNAAAQPSRAIEILRFVPLVVVGAAIGFVAAGAIWLWAAYGTTVFFETIRAGLAACVG